MEASFRTLFEEIVHRYPGAPFLYQENSSLTFERAKEAAYSLASFLMKAGVKEGCLIAIKAKPDFTTGLFLYATQCIGAIAMPFDPSLSEEDVKKICKREPFFVEAFIENAAKARYFVKSPRGRLDYLSSSQHFPAPSFKEVDSNADALWIIDGNAKGEDRIVRHSQTSYINLLRHYEKSWGCVCRDNLIALMPFHQTIGLSMFLLSALIGYTLHIPEHFDKDHILDYLYTHGINILDGNAPLLYSLAKRGSERKMRFPNLRHGLIVGAQIKAEDFRFIESALGIELFSINSTGELLR